MNPNLSFEQAPPLSVPYRFLLTAPWFGVAAGVFLGVRGEGALTTRWAPDTLVLTHLLTVGFMLQAMFGALLQVIPVAAGGNVWRPRLVASVVHPLLTIAAAVLAFAFIGGRPELFVWAGSLFAVAVSGYLAVVGWATVRTPATGDTIVTIRFSLVGLGVAVALGVTLALALGGRVVVPIMEMTNVHAAWALGGWSLLLLAGVSYFVVPMFQLTPPYPRWFSRGLAPALTAVLVLFSLQLTGKAAAWQTAVWLAGLALSALFGGVTLHLQRRRRRKVTDATFKFFRNAMACLIVILASALVATVIPAVGEDPRMSLSLGVLALVGVFVSAITGMLYKIIPFLNWLHLQRLGEGSSVLPPNMNQVVREPVIRGQMRLHFAALIALLAAVWLPVLARPAGLLFAASSAWLGLNLISGLRVYLRVAEQFRAQTRVA